MTINISVPANWKAQLPGLGVAVGLFLTQWQQSGQAFNLKSPLFWSALASAVFAYFSKAKDVTGGTKPNTANDPAVVATTSEAKAEAPKP